MQTLAKDDIGSHHPTEIFPIFLPLNVTLSFSNISQQVYTWLMISKFIELIRKIIRALFDSFSERPSQLKQSKEYHYRHKDFLMTYAEADFYRLLLQVVGEKYAVYPQVHLSAIIEHKIKGQNWKAAFRHINGKSVDFVVCDTQNFKPIAAIELDDKTHEYKNRRIRDEEVERILSEARLPLARFTRQQNIEEVRQKLSEFLSF